MTAEQPGRALLVGINRYPKLSDAVQLSGCVNDVRLMASLLQERFGFAGRGVTVLEDSQATRSGILAAMEGLLHQTGQDEVVVLFFSGHGSRMRDREGDKPDGWDQTIVPHDSGRHSHPNRDITDDEIHAWLLRLSAVTPHIVLIFDSCYSGSIARDPLAATVRWLEPDLRPVEQLPPSPLAPGSLSSGFTRGPSGWLPLSDRYVLMAACRGDEHSFEIKLQPGPVDHGAFTYFLARELAGAGGETSYRDIVERCRDQVTAVFARQHPQIEGACDCQVLGRRALTPMRFVPVRERSGRRIVLGGGAAHGLTIGSRWALYPPACKRAQGVPRQGLAELRAVRATSADAVLIEEVEADLVGPGSRAVEHSRSFEMQLAVGCDRHAPAELAEAIERSLLLRLATDDEQAQLRVCLVGARDSIRATDSAPQLGAVREPVWIVVGPDGSLLAPPGPVSAAGSVPGLLETLETRARFCNIMALHSPDSTLRGQVGLVLRRWKDDRWQVVEGEAAFEEGDRIALEVVNRSEIPLHVTILDLGISGRISLVYPIEGAHDVLPPGCSLEIGVREGDRMELAMPAGYPVAGTTGGTELLKLFATAGEFDLAPLRKPVASAAATTISRLVAAALGGQRMRSTRVSGGGPGELWTTLTRSFLLHSRRGQGEHL